MVVLKLGSETYEISCGLDRYSSKIVYLKNQQVAPFFSQLYPNATDIMHSTT